MCTRDKEFTIRGIEDCLARGYRPRRLFRGRYRRAAILDGAARPNSAEQAPLAARCSRASRWCRRRRSPGRPTTVAKQELMRRLRRTKIVATLGPASSDRNVIASLFRAGADVFRINMSHTSHDRMRELVAAIRAVEIEYGRPIGILVDLQGPKLRVGKFAEGPVTLAKGETFTLDSDPAPGDADARPPAASGNLRRDQAGPRAAARRRQGAAHSHRGRRQPHRHPRRSRRQTVGPQGRQPARHARCRSRRWRRKDRSDLEAALDADVDWIALSFIQRPEDIAEAKKITRGRAAVMAKIEKPQAVDRLEEIIELADALMVARGDLGVEMPLEKVPGIQKRMTRVGAPRRQAGGGRDADARIDDHEPGADARRSLRRRHRHLRRRRCRDAVGRIRRRPISGRGGHHDEPHRRGGRKRPLYRTIIHAQRTEPEPTGADAIAAAARQIAETLDLPAIICWTFSGSTALRVARERPKSPIVAISPNLATARRLSLVWGVHCVVAEDAHDLDDMVDRACRIAFKDGFAKAGQRVIVVAGVPLGTPGATNMLRIAFVGSEPVGD